MKEISIEQCHTTAKDTFQTKMFKGRGINATNFLNHTLLPSASTTCKKITQQIKFLNIGVIKLSDILK
jgi:hypothetical protein